jgi:glutathione S-transferase
MTEIILHEYPLSLFAEKIRRILAYKRVPWRSVEQPMTAPKPELTALTGGYRRIPVLQIGADVYCDTACIARRLERLHPEPSCMPRGQAGLVAMIEEWGDHRFTGQVTPSVIVDLLPSLPDGILVDRAAMSPFLSREAIVAAAPHTLTQALLSLDLLDAALGDRPFLAGETFSIADAACFHQLWFLERSPRLFEAVTARPALAAWFSRIRGFGPGVVRPMARQEALAIAREAEPTDVSGDGRVTAGRFAVGDAVVVTADDYGREETRGTVARVTPDEVTLRRRDPLVGDVAVHFPRSGYRIARA